MVKAVKIALFCLLPVFFACKKNYSCACKITIADTRPPATVKTSNSTQPMSEKMTEPQATSACEAIKFQLRDNFSKQVTADPQVSVYVSCDVK